MISYFLWNINKKIGDKLNFVLVLLKFQKDVDKAAKWCYALNRKSYDEEG